LVLIHIASTGCCQEKVVTIPEQILNRQKVVFTTPPSRIPVPHSVDAPLLGNGFTGVAISGNPEKQVYHISRNDFWRLKSSFNNSFPAVLGTVEVSIPGLTGASYLIEQDLYKAKTLSSFAKKGQNVLFRTFVSATEDLMVVEIILTGEGELEGTINLDLPGPQQLIDNPPFDRVFPTETEIGNAADGIYYISRAFEEEVDIPTKAVCALTILGGKSNDFKLSEGNPVALVVAFSSNFKSDYCLQAVIQRLRGVRKKEVRDVEAEHEAWWKDFWSRSYVDINDSLIEKQYFLSNYSLACFSRDKEFPPSIFGTTITKERPHWNGDYHLNYNHFAPYYGLFSSNHIEQAIPCNIAVLAQQDRGEYYSKKICRIDGGILLPVGAGPLGIETTRKNELMVNHRAHWFTEGNVEDEGLFFGQKSNSSYCVVNMAMHFYTTYDEEFTALYYPFVKAVATFWENYMIWENGRYVIYNDAIHEGTVGTMNPILSLGLARLVMQTAIDMSSELDVDADRREKWQYIKENISDYTYQERKGKKVFRYSEKGTAWWNDNTLGIQHIYPASQIGLDSDPGLLQVARNTIDVMKRWIDFNGSNSFFPAAVRVGYNADTILTQMHKYVNNTYSNGFQLHNPHGIENFSTIPNTINEMLCMGHGGVLRVFPVWPNERDACFHNLRTYGAFLVSSELNNGQVSYVKIISEKGKTCRFMNPWHGIEIHLMSNMSKVRKMEGAMLEIETKQGEEILLKPIH